jgi:hypothetical protein
MSLIATAEQRGRGKREIKLARLLRCSEALGTLCVTGKCSEAAIGKSIVQLTSRLFSQTRLKIYDLRIS